MRIRQTGKVAHSTATVDLITLAACRLFSYSSRQMCLKFCSKKGSDRLSATSSNNTPRHNHHIRFTDEAPRQSGPGRDNDPCLRANPHHSPQEQPRSPDSSSSPSNSRLPCNSSFRSPSSANHSNPPVHRPCKFNRLSAGCCRHSMTSYPCCCNPSTPTAGSPPSCNCHEHLLWEFRFGYGHCCCTGCQHSYEVNEEIDDWNCGAKGEVSQTDCNVIGSKPDHSISTGNGKRDSTQRSRSPNADQQRAQPYQASAMVNSKPWSPPYVLVNGVPFTPQVQVAQLPQIQTTYVSFHRMRRFLRESF